MMDATIKKIFINIGNIVKAEFFFFKPKKNDIVFFDYKGYSTIKKFFNKKHFVLNARYEKINLFIVLKTILTYKTINTFYYIRCYLSYLKPKIIIHHSYNPNFFRIKEYFPRTKMVLIQSEFFWPEYYKKFSKYKNSCDYFFGWGNLDINKIKKFTNSKCYLMGSIFNNKIKINNNIRINKTILYISQFREKNNNSDVTLPDGNKYSYDKFYIGEKVLLKRIDKFASEEKLKLHILGCKTLPVNFKEEKSYYENILENNFNIIRRRNQFSNYKEILKYKIIISCDSTLAYEALSKKLNVGIFNYRKAYINAAGLNSEYYNKNYKFFSSNNSIKEFNRLMKYLLKNQNCKIHVTSKIKEKLKSIIYYNYNNLVLRNNLNKILNKNV